MDQKFRLISLKEQHIIAVYHEHTTGMRKLSYCHLYNSSIASVAHENYINIWSPEISLFKAHVGRLEGHNSTVIDAAFCEKTPFLISLDIKENCRIWDIRKMNCLQIITRNCKPNSLPTGLLLFPYSKHKFVIHGKKLVTYQNGVDEDEEDKSDIKTETEAMSKIPKKKKEEENTCIAVEFNYYLLQIMIVTRKQIRFYDPANGSLIKVFNDFLKKKHINDICSFWLDDRHRKFFIGDMFGNINVFNASSGVHIKTVEHAGYNLNKVLNKLSSEVTSMNFLNLMDCCILITSTWDSSIKVYDEDDPEESLMIREARGNIQSDEMNKEYDWMKIITTLAFDEHLGLIATGSNVGKLAIWDIESFKIEAFLAGNSKEITSITFVTPYPLLVSA